MFVFLFFSLGHVDRYSVGGRFVLQTSGSSRVQRRVESPRNDLYSQHGRKGRMPTRVTSFWQSCNGIITCVAPSLCRLTLGIMCARTDLIFPVAPIKTDGPFFSFRIYWP